MEQTQTVKSQPAKEKLAYEAPKAEFVPLQVEERLLGCGKVSGSHPTCNTTPSS